MPVKGTLGLLEEADVRRLVDFPKALAKLQATTIFLSVEIVQDALKRYHGRHQDLAQTLERDCGIDR